METSRALALVRQHYPAALSTGEAVDRFLDLVARRFALDPAHLVLADSVCSDDVNSVEYPRRAFEMVGPFRLGGLDGYPFAGLTGMGAFASHVPEDGALFVYHAPHIGVSRDGALGEIYRLGQGTPSACCGAARAALRKLEAGTLVPAPPGELDYQQETLEQRLLPHRERILGAASPLREATEVLHEAITLRIDELVARTAVRARYVLVMGAILVNGDADMGSFTDIRRLVAIEPSTGRREDLTAELLANAP